MARRKSDKAEQPAVTEAVESNEQKAEEETQQMTEAPKGKLMVASRIKENGKVLEIGSVYKGDHAQELLEAGALEQG
jgi:Ni,Fe-hydrogenase III large subunit